MIYLRYLTLIVILLVVVTCNPERDNPLDPRSPLYTGEATIKGLVKTFAGNPIQDATVSATNIDTQLSVSTNTDETGGFCISVYKGAYNVTAMMSGYLDSSMEVAIDAGEVREILFNLDGIPFSIVQAALSSRMATWIGSVVDIYISAEVGDPDGLQDIDSVFVEVLEVKKYMAFNPQPQMYECRISENECPGGNSEFLIGPQFVVTAVDQKGVRGSSVPFYLIRIFREFPLSISPPDGAVVPGDDLQIIWHKLKTDFPISYLVQIFIGWPPQVVYEETTQDTVLVVASTLSEGEYYYWVLAADEYGNTARSLAKRFRVE